MSSLALPSKALFNTFFFLTRLKFGLTLHLLLEGQVEALLHALVAPNHHVKTVLLKERHGRVRAEQHPGPSWVRLRVGQARGQVWVAPQRAVHDGAEVLLTPLREW